jgi:hypothetical protein
MAVQSPGAPPLDLPEKSYLGEAFITLLLYYLGFGLIGLIANILFLNNARRDERTGVVTRNVGCLQVLLWVHIALLALACLIGLFVLFTGGLATVLALFSEG